MEKVYIGKIVSTHGIKGEVKILSDFEYKNKVFAVGNNLIIDDKEFVIRSYRRHKIFDMVTLNDYKDINEVLYLMKKKVFFDKEKLLLDDSEVLDEELISYQVLTSDGKRGIIKEIFWASPTNKLIRVMFEREVLIPVFSPMIKKIDKNKQEVLVELYEKM